MGFLLRRLLDEELAFRDDVAQRTGVWMSPIETRILRKLVVCRTVGQDALAYDLWPDEDGFDFDSDKRIRVHICHIRAKFGDLIDLLTFWGQGYYLQRLGPADNPLLERKRI